MAYHRNMTRHMLTPLRNKREPAHLVANAIPDATQGALFLDRTIPAGRVLHLDKSTGPGVLPGAKLGCTGAGKIPVWLYRPGDSYSAGYISPDPTINDPSWATGMEGGVLVYIGLEGFEMMTTEYDDSQEYKVGDYVRAPEHNPGASDPVAHARDVAGKLTTAGAVFGSTTIVGQVSPGLMASHPIDDQGRDPFRNKVMSVYTCYHPPVQQLVTGTPTTGTAGL